MVYWCSMLSNPPFPVDLLKLVSPVKSITWNWQDFEQIHWQFQRALVRSLVECNPNQREFALKHILRGAIGNEGIMNCTILLNPEIECYEEEKQFIPKSTFTNPIEFSDLVFVKNESKPINMKDGGVFLCAPGNVCVDGRMVFASSTSSSSSHSLN